ncbi:phage tail spike protein [Paenibacillus sp. USHLN196]|uniref:phage tail spike protein n=1 Tax=Paenibacillus sp. USHLN196 TaxID=3081291 RepID=UPI003017E89A
MLGRIDYTKKPITPQYFLAKPNREIISKLSEAFNDSIDVRFNDISSLKLSIPYFIDRHHKLKPNKNVELIKEKYLIQAITGHKTEWFIIQDIEDSLQESDIMNVSCFSLEHELTHTLIKSYSVESYGADKVLTDILANTLWNIDYIDADFKLSKRAFDFPSTHAYDAICTVADTYNAILHFDTDSHTLSMTKPELTGINMGLTISYGKYLKSMNKKSDSKEIVTRLFAYGKDGLGIQKVNSTGQNYIENYSYFLYPFERDANKTVISSSYYMSDSLCHALLDYDKLVESKDGLFKQYLEELQGYETQLNQLKIDLNKLQNDEKVIQEVKVTQQFGDKMFFEKYQHSGSTSRTFKLNKGYNYAAMIKVDSSSGVTVALNGSVKPITSGRWVMLGKLNNLETTTITVNGSSTGVFMQVATISIEEHQMAGNDAAIVERYSLDNKENQINLKQIEVSNKLNQITNVQNRTKALQVLLDSENNFTNEQLQELKKYVYEREFSDDVYIDEQDLYDATLEKFKELRVPQLTIEIDTVNFLEIVTEQRNWKKLNLGDFVNIKYEPLDIEIEARITEISYDFGGSSINLTLSNAKDVNKQSSKLEKYIRESRNTSVVVDTNKTKWGQAVVDSSDMSKLFDNFWNKITNEINMNLNNTVQLNNQGITVSDPDDPLRFIRITHSQIGVTRSGGLRFETALDSTGLIAEMVYGKILLGQKAVIGDTIGVLTIEGSKLMIDDRCGRPVLRLGMISELPDVFGLNVNRYASSNCNDKTITNVSGIDNNRGFYIDKIRNGVTSNVFGLSQEGDLRLRVGDNNEIMLLTSEGLSLGADSFSASPFRVDFNGNMWAKNAFIENSTVKDSDLIGNRITLRDAGGVMKMWPSQGLWAGLISEGAEDFDKAAFSVDMEGNLKAHKAKFYGKAGDILFDTDAGYLDMDKMDIINVGKLMAEMLEVNTILADDGYVNNLTVNRLKTIGKDAEVGEYIDFIDIQDNYQRWITAKVLSKAQAKDSRDRLLFWQDSEKRILTTEDTGIIAYAYKLTDEKIKHEITFTGSGNAASPVRKVGTGDGGADDRAKFVETKYNGGLKQEYKASNTAKLRNIDLRDNGIAINSEDGIFAVQSKDFQFIADGGTYKLGLANGSVFELASTGLKMDIQGNIDIKATGNIKMNGTRIDLN